jgi:hypothetical protein
MAAIVESQGTPMSVYQRHIILEVYGGGAKGTFRVGVLAPEV